MNRCIVPVSGGLASAYCLKLCLEENHHDEVIPYFNDVKWEHESLYEFLDGLEKLFGVKIYRDSDGRNPEELFYDNGALANDRMPFCSRILKNEMLKTFYKNGDEINFGISKNESRRKVRIKNAWDLIQHKTGKVCTVRFPLILYDVQAEQIKAFFKKNLFIPKLYELGFDHNNCSGGCVRQGKKQWVHLLKTLPEVYAERERVEIEFNEWKGGTNFTFMKNLSLTELRKKVELQLATDSENTIPECFGVCDLEA